MAMSVNPGGGVVHASSPAGRNRLWIAGICIVLLFAVLTVFVRNSSTARFAGFPLWQIVVVAGILFVSGLMSGLSGFGFSAVGSACLLLIQPKLAVPLLMALSTANQFMSIGQLREDMPKSWHDAWKGPGPYIVGGVVGVPIGIWLLNHLPAARLMLVFGTILTVYSIFSLLRTPRGGSKEHSRPASGIIVGFIGGTVGGFTAFPGAAVVVWTGLRNLPKQLTRSIVQPYILVLQVVSLATNAYAHPSVFGKQFWSLLAITLPIVLPGTIAGVLLYRRISDVNFRRVSFILLGLSGVGLLVKVLMK